jgi:hypothetical protein
MQNFLSFLETVYYFMNKGMFVIPAGMGTGAHEAALVCERNGQVRTCVKKSHTTSCRMGGFPYQWFMA